jgi:AcrR family transcriptional regulator
MPGLRERKKQRTREVIVQAAMKLFAERGYDGTTITDIAEAADISPRTFFGYFPAKEDLVFHDQDELLESMAERIRDRPPGENAFDALRAWVLAYDEEADFARPEEVARRQLIRDTPALAARERTNIARLEEVLAEAVARDLGVEPCSLRPRLVAAAAVAALDAIARMHDIGTDAPVRSAEEVLHEAFLFLQGGLEALRGLSPPGPHA